MYLIVDLIWMRYSPLLRWCIKITTVSFSRKLCPTFWLRSNSISSSSTGNWAWSSNRSSQATTTFVSDEVLCVLNLDSGRLSSESSLPRRDMARFWNQRERLGVDLNDNNPFTATGLVQSVERLTTGRRSRVLSPGPDQLSGSQNNWAIKILSLPCRRPNLHVAWMATLNGGPVSIGRRKHSGVLSY